jgi:hypothetical protein
MRTLGPTIAIVPAALALAGCVMAAQTPDGSFGITAGSFNYHFTGPPGCTGALAQFKSLIDSDAMAGHLDKRVHERAAAELDAPRASCSAGREGEAVRQLAAIKARYGYR